MKRKTAYYLLAAILIYLLLKFWFTHQGDDEPYFLLMPVSELTGLLTGSQAVFISGEGFYLTGLNIIINKSCSGFNFCCICFFLLCFVAAIHSKGGIKEFLILISLSLLISYCMTVFVNAFRILLAVGINQYLKTISIRPPGWLHIAEGMFVYLFFLILIYIISNYLYTKYNNTYENIT